MADEWNGDKAKIVGRKIIGKSVFEAGLIIEAQAVALAPVDTARLRGSISTQTKTQEHKNQNSGKAESEDFIDKPTKDNTAYVGTNVEYGEYIEYGTIRSRAQPYMRPALDLAQGKVLTVFERNGKLEFEGF